MRYVSENSSTRRYINTFTYWKKVKQMVSITPCHQTQDADDPKQLEWEFSYHRVLQRCHSSHI